MDFNNSENEWDQNTTIMGITLIGVIIGIALTISFSFNIDLWKKIGLTTVLVIIFLLLIKLITQKGHGPLSAIAKWTINSP